MISIRKSCQRGYADHGWLKSFHSFSFANYFDPEHMGFGNLRVINEDRVAPGTGFGTHGHRDMEIVSVVLDGELAHRDNLGNGSTIRPGEVQRMSAGRGVMHSEYNHATNRTTHFLQIWIEPSRKGIEPGYEQRAFEPAGQRGALQLIAAPAGESDLGVTLHADARLYRGAFDGDESATLAVAPGRLVYVHVVQGQIEVQGTAVSGGDAVKLADEPTVSLKNGRDAQVLVFDLAPGPSP